MKSAPRIVLLLGVALASMASSSPQCARSGDQVFRPSGAGSLVAAEGLAGCVDACNEVAKTARDREQERHRAAVAACNGEPGCGGAEGRNHAIIMQELAAEAQACKAGCHNQGTATGGQ